MESVEKSVIRTIQPYAQAQLSSSTVLLDAGMSSLDMVCAIQEIEQEFEIYVHDADFKSIRTVADIVDLVTAGLPNDPIAA